MTALDRGALLDVAEELLAERGRGALGTGVTSWAVDSLRAVLGHQLGGGALESWALWIRPMLSTNLLVAQP